MITTNLTTYKKNTYNLTNGSDKPLLSIGSKLTHLTTETTRALFFVL